MDEIQSNKTLILIHLYAVDKNTSQSVPHSCRLAAYKNILFMQLHKKSETIQMNMKSYLMSVFLIGAEMH